jgi:nitrous oxide reductase
VEQDNEHLMSIMVEETNLKVEDILQVLEKAKTNSIMLQLILNEYSTFALEKKEEIEQRKEAMQYINEELVTFSFMDKYKDSFQMSFLMQEKNSYNKSRQRKRKFDEVTELLAEVDDMVQETEDEVISGENDLMLEEATE